MNITLITWDYTTQIYSTRLLATILKNHGHSIRIVLAISYLDDYRKMHTSDAMNRKIPGILDLVKDSEIIGLSFLSIHHKIAKTYARRIKKAFPEKTIISGGIHASAEVQETLEFSDYVCAGEGEILFPMLLEQIENRSIEPIAGVFTKRYSEQLSYAVSVTDLDQNPIPGFFFDSTYIYNCDKNIWEIRDVEKFIPVNGRGRSRFSYYLFPDRGCVLNCSYCCRPLIKKISKTKGMRFRSVPHIIKELKCAKDSIPNLQRIMIYSDDFFNWSYGKLNDFIISYVNCINLPFNFLFSPRTFDRDKLELLLDTGLVSTIAAGVQTGSQRMRKIYNRPEKNEDIVNLSKELKGYSQKYNIVCTFDFIVDEFWETESDRLDSLKLLCEMTRPFNVNLYTLTLFPGTELYRRAIREKIITKEEYKQQFNLKNSLNKRLSSTNQNIDVYIRLCGMCSLLPVPYWFIRQLFRMNIALPHSGIGALKTVLLGTRRKGFLSTMFDMIRRNFIKITKSDS